VVWAQGFTAPGCFIARGPIIGWQGCGTRGPVERSFGGPGGGSGGGSRRADPRSRRPSGKALVNSRMRGNTTVVGPPSHVAVEPRSDAIDKDDVFRCPKCSPPAKCPPCSKVDGPAGLSDAFSSRVEKRAMEVSSLALDEPLVRPFTTH